MNSLVFNRDMNHETKHGTYNTILITIKKSMGVTHWALAVTFQTVSINSSMFNANYISLNHHGSNEYIKILNI